VDLVEAQIRQMEGTRMIRRILVGLTLAIPVIVFLVAIAPITQGG